MQILQEQCTCHRLDPPPVLCLGSQGQSCCRGVEALTVVHAGSTTTSTPPEFDGEHSQSEVWNIHVCLPVHANLFLSRTEQNILVNSNIIVMHFHVNFLYNIGICVPVYSKSTNTSYVHTTYQSIVPCCPSLFGQQDRHLCPTLKDKCQIHMYNLLNYIELFSQISISFLCIP